MFLDIKYVNKIKAVKRPLSENNGVKYYKPQI